jgi:methylase of polypeptide subunit release factors
MGSPAQFASARDFLQKSAFAEKEVCAALKLDSLSVLGTLKENEINLSNIPTPLALLIRIFVLLQPVPRHEFEAAIPLEIISHLEALGLIRRFNLNNWVASVFLYPVLNFVIASDRHANADGSPFEAPPDVVFPAIFPGTLRFLRLVPTSPADEALDLCAGSGIGALIMSAAAKKAVSADITSRATYFAEFNRLLNGRGNVECLQGDLYDPVTGRTFDRITAHPPYVPSLGDDMVFRDGGELGETVLRRAIEGLVTYLRPAGTFTALCVGLDTKAARFEARVRSWLGARESEFDLVFACGNEKNPEDALKDISYRASSISTFKAQDLSRTFADVTKVSYGALFIRRRSGDGPTLTLRPRLSEHTDAGCLEWFIGWLDRRDAIAKSIASSRPHLARDVRIKSTHGVSGKGLVPVEFFLETARPFSATTRFDDPWIIPLIAQFDGSRSLAELHASARVADEIPADFDLDNFSKLVLMLAERGYVTLPEWPLPVTA